MTQQQAGQRVWRAALIVLLASIVAGCAASTGDDGGGDGGDDQAGEPEPVSLVGSWVRVDGAACRAGYPLAIEFREIDYLVELDPATAPVIDSGGYELIDATTIWMTRPNDAMVALTLRLGDGELTLTDEAGCVVDYRRA